jgi:hypothetical protein
VGRVEATYLAGSATLNEPSDPEILRFVNRWTAEMREVMIQQVNDLRIRRFDFNLADQKVGCACITRYP